MLPDATQLTWVETTLTETDNQTVAPRIITAPDEAVSRLLDGEAVWVPRTLLPAIQRTLALVAQFAQRRCGG